MSESSVDKKACKICELPFISMLRLNMPKREVYLCKTCLQTLREYIKGWNEGK